MFGYLKHCNSTRLIKCRNTIELVKAILERPLQKRNLQALAKKLHFTERQTARAAGITLRSYNKLLPTSRLSIPATDNIIKLSELFEVGTTTFSGNAKALREWLNTSSTELNGYQPIELLDGYMSSSYITELLRQMRPVQVGVISR